MQVVAVKPAKGIDLHPVIVVMVTIAMIAKILKMVVSHLIVLVGADQLLCMRSSYTLWTLTVFLMIRFDFLIFRILGVILHP